MSQNREQVHKAIEQISAADAADDVLANLDYGAVDALGDDGIIDEDSDLFKNVTNQVAGRGGLRVPPLQTWSSGIFYRMVSRTRPPGSTRKCQKVP